MQCTGLSKFAKQCRWLASTSVYAHLVKHLRPISGIALIMSKQSSTSGRHQQGSLTSKHRGRIIGAVVAVQLVQAMVQTPLEGQLDALLHVLEARIDDGCWNSHTRKASQALCKPVEILQDPQVPIMRMA